MLRSVERFGMGYGVLGKRSNETKNIKSYTKIYKLSRWKFQILIDVCRKSSYYNPLCSYQKHVHTEEFLGVFRSLSRQFYIFCSGGGLQFAQSQEKLYRFTWSLINIILFLAEVII